MDKTAGIIGLGIMGGAIARNLVERGWHVIGFDIDAARRSELAAANVEIAADVAQVASHSPIIMTSLPGPVAVEQVAQNICLRALSLNSRRSVLSTSFGSNPCWRTPAMLPWIAR
jgi:3-hydroxyisobutyrate dehydrogenase-like beta-hydroxyacid dehydrogenase